jgi:hypothetical protein
MMCLIAKGQTMSMAAVIRATTKTPPIAQRYGQSQRTYSRKYRRPLHLSVTASPLLAGGGLPIVR